MSWHDPGADVWDFEGVGWRQYNKVKRELAWEYSLSNQDLTFWQEYLGMTCCIQSNCFSITVLIYLKWLVKHWPDVCSLRIWEYLHPTALVHNQSLHYGIHIDMKKEWYFKNECVSWHGYYQDNPNPVPKFLEDNYCMHLLGVHKEFEVSANQLSWSLARGHSCHKTLSIWDACLLVRVEDEVQWLSVIFQSLY